MLSKTVDILFQEGGGGGGGGAGGDTTQHLASDIKRSLCESEN